MSIELYNTSADYANQSGFNQIAYPLRDSIAIINPFFVILFGLLVVLTIASYYAFVTFTGKTRYFNSILASSFSVTVISIFFSLAGWITPLHVMTFIALTVVSYLATIFYK